MVSVDIYLNETTRHADVILPPPSHLERSHYDVLLSNFAVRNVANWSAPVFERNPDQPDEWEILARLTELAQGRVPDPAAFGEQLVRGLLHAATNDGASPMAGRDIDELVALVTGDSAPDRLLDVMVRVGPFGDGFGARPGGLSLALLAAHPHGLDYGPLEPRLPEILRTASGRIEAAPEPLLADLRALADDLHRPIAPDQLLLVGRRDLRSNNSWMHNIGVLVSGSDRCTLQIHPDDANRLGVLDGALVRVTSASGSLDVAASVTADLRPGVVSLPHGWGHDLPGAALSVAAAHPGVNSNRLSPVTVDPLSGNAVLTAIEVRVEPVEVPVH
jgi:anaerobic selenocysteine-containing dehydrogenase